MLITVAFSFSKGAWLSALGAILFYEIHRFFSSQWVYTIGPSLRIFLIFLGLIFAVTSFSESWVASYTSQVEKAIQNSSDTNDERLNYAIQASILTLENPVFGVGPKNYENAAKRSGFLQTTDPHNALLWVGAELGIGGFFLTAALFLWLFYKAMMSAHGLTKWSSHRPLNLLIFCLILNIPLHGLPISSKYLWIAIALVVSLSRINKNLFKARFWGEHIAEKS
jgi:O-antigen ligase